MKKIFLAIMSMILCTILAFPILAEFENPPIVDKAGYLTQEQFNDLSDQLEEIRERYNFDVAIYTEKDMSGLDAMNTADDIFDYNGYGAGDGDHGILLYVSTNPRYYWMTTHGDGEIFFNENGLKYIEEKFLPYLKEDDYSEAFQVYVQSCDELLDLASKGTPFNEKQNDSNFIFMVISGAILLPLIIAYALMRNKLAKMKTARKEDHAANYVKPESMKLDVSRDIFLYSSTIKREKPKTNSNSHTSSSGRSHGGRGGSY